MIDWKETTLGEILELITDYHSNGSYETLKENVELLDQKDFAIMIRTTNFEQNSFSENLKYISEHSYYFLKKSMVYQGDIIMNKIANAGSVYFMPNLNYPVSLAMNLFLIRINKEKANQRFIFYYLKVNESYIKQFAEGSVTKTITKNAVKNLIIKKPCIETQNEIVKVIESLENKIDNLKRQNETLEQIAQTLFKHWFIDFEFPHADGKPYKSSGGAMSPSELGDIPEGWRVEILKNIMTLNYGKSLTAENRINGKYPVVGSNGIVDTHTDFFVKAPGIVIGRKGTIGKVIWIEENFYPIDTTFYIEDNLGCEGLYFHYFLLKNQKFNKLTSDSAVPGLNRDMAYSVEFAISSNALINQYNSIAKTIFHKINNNEKQIQTLTKTRDTLLPKLMSGQLRVDI